MISCCVATSGKWREGGARRWRGAHGGQADFESAVDEWEFHSLARADPDRDTVRLLREPSAA